MDSISKLGYKNNSPYKNENFLYINSPNGSITMDGVDKALFAKDLSNGESRILQPNSGEHYFKGSNILEIPVDKLRKTQNTMFNRPTDKKLWLDVFNRNKLRMGGYAQPNAIMDKTYKDYARKRGGFIFNPDGDGKPLSFVQKQEGGYTYTPKSESFNQKQEPSPQQEESFSMPDKPYTDDEEDDMDYNSFQGEDVEMTDHVAVNNAYAEPSLQGEDFGEWAVEALGDGVFKTLPSNVQDELAYFKDDETAKDVLNEDYARKYLPNSYRIWSAGNANQNAPKNDGVDKRVTETKRPMTEMSDVKTPPANSEKQNPQNNLDPVKRHGGYTNYQNGGTFNDFINREKLNRMRSRTPDNYTEGTRIKYQKGGQIHEGVIRSYDSNTGNIELY